MTIAATLIFTTLLVGLLFIPFYIILAKRLHIIDHPNDRSSHTIPTPRGGGIFIALSTVAIVVTKGYYTETNSTLYSTFAVATSLIIGIGFWDDLRSLPSLLRLGSHIAASLLIVSLVSRHAGGSLCSFESLLMLCGVTWIVGCLNIYNFMDGIDGIASCQGIAAAIAWLAIALSSQSALGTTIAASILGGLIAFLCFNWSPAKVFMGDGTSGFLGFCFAVLPLLIAEYTPTDLLQKTSLAALILFPFLFDGIFTLIRRALNKENLLLAHRTHLYQRWHLSGASHKAVTSFYAAWAILAGAAAISTHFEKLHILPAFALAAIPAIILLFKSSKFPR